MPPKTTVPSDCWLAEPAPVAVRSGTTPRMNAIEVIRIGRKRRRVASTAASTVDIPPALSSRANSTIRIAFLAASAIISTRPICVYRSFGKRRIASADDDADERHRHGENDRGRIDPAFVLRGEHQEDQA